MGQDVAGRVQTPDQVRAFSKASLRDCQALERLLEEGLFETGIRRIGAEQEMSLVNEAWRPASTALEVLDGFDGPFTTELALYNLEANVEPRELEGRRFTTLHQRIDELVGEVRDVAQGVDTEIAYELLHDRLSRSG